MEEQEMDKLIAELSSKRRGSIVVPPPSGDISLSSIFLFFNLKKSISFIDFDPPPSIDEYPIPSRFPNLPDTSVNIPLGTPSSKKSKKMNFSK